MLSEVEALKFLYIELGWVLKDKDPTTLPLFIMECIDRLPVRRTQTGVNAVITTSHACPPEADLPSAWFVRVFRIPACTYSGRFGQVATHCTDKQSLSMPPYASGIYPSHPYRTVRSGW